MNVTNDDHQTEPSRRSWARIRVMIALALVASFLKQDISDDLIELTQGVHKLSQVGVPGIVSAISKDAVPFVVGDDSGARPVAVAGRLGKGRIAAIGHGGYLSMQAIKEADNGRLVLNMVKWCSRRKSEIKVGTFRGRTTGVGRELGFQEITVTDRTMSDADVVIVTDTVDPASILDYIMKGGGVVVGQTPWGWKQVHAADSLLGDFGWNEVLARAGIVYSDGTIDHPKVIETFEAAKKVNAAEEIPKLSEDVNAVGVIAAAIRDCPENTEFAKSVRALVKGSAIKAPSKQEPLTQKDGLSRLALVIKDMDRKAGFPVTGIDPSAVYFPGLVKSGTPRQSKTVAISVNDGQWSSTGCYAAPGEQISVTLPPSLVGKGLGLQIGVHSDELWHLPKWERNPSVVVKTKFTSDHAELISPFGGLVVITVPSDLGLKPQKITLENIVGSPRFVLGETTVAQWQESLKSGAPWAELQSKHLILSVPTSEAAKVADPTPLMKLWDHVMDLYTELDGSPLTIRPERIVADQQISAGYMHSGYPIMTWMDDSVPLSLSYDRLTKDGTWGHWHELGHNRQKGWWTFSGTGEVTNNVYVLYAMQKIDKKSLFDRIGKNKAETDAYLLKPDFEVWKSKPFTALTMYAQLIDAFGWDSYKKVMRAYLSAPKGDLPKTDEEKRDQRMVRYSRQVGKNLAPFFEKWGVPVSPVAKQLIQDLPAWQG